MSDETVTKIVTNNELREQLAGVQHAIWAHWMRYMFSCGTFSPETGNWIMPADKALRWERQMNTDYSELTERERNSDRDQADKVLAVLAPVLAENEQLRAKLTAVPVVSGETSDGYHTFNELYAHRCSLFALLLNTYDVVALEATAFKTWRNSEGEVWDGWFIAGLNTKYGQITYHLPAGLWDLLYVPEVERNTDYDGHTSQDVITRLSLLLEVQP